MCAKIILSINAGSSSVKVSVYKAKGKAEDPAELAVVQVAGLTAPPATLTYDRGDEHVRNQRIEGVSSQEDGFRYILDHLTNDKGLPELTNKEDIEFACHRVVHGGDYTRAQVIDVATYHHLEELSDLAPLHNAGALTIVRAVHSHLPSATNIAYFDSSFHSTMPEHIRTYPIDPKIAKRNKLRKYGFHGISYAFITKAVTTYLHRPVGALNIIALHLGSGASACCIRGGASLDTSMGLTPLAGLPGATRSGDVDPSLVFHYTHDAGKPSASSSKALHITAAEDILNKQSGWAALTGTTDFGAIMASDAAECTLATDIFVDRIAGFVASYYVKLAGRLDALVFAGGIGEKGAELRRRVVEALECLGFELDAARNQGVREVEGVVVDVGKSGARHGVLVCRTDEQLEMARGCVAEAETFRSRSGVA
ncbi:hypothetical protein B0A49_04472 [Cryomyces minteri]|uniref:Probable acetate kinase n=1 Tax=Cryomyces minteri TaxID=331657 RepID=A0A4U0XC36_9PEZI|nr:hypothetical protein B0A49_04472 [Cryomyces minteri]